MGTLSLTALRFPPDHPSPLNYSNPEAQDGQAPCGRICVLLIHSDIDAPCGIRTWQPETFRPQGDTHSRGLPSSRVLPNRRLNGGRGQVLAPRRPVEVCVRGGDECASFHGNCPLGVMFMGREGFCLDCDESCSSLPGKRHNFVFRYIISFLSSVPESDHAHQG